MFRQLPQGQLAVSRGSTHFAPVERNEWMATIAQAFLAAPMLAAK